MSRVVGYARVSTGEQTFTLQIDALHCHGAAKVYKEVVSGAASDRPQLDEALASLQPGDTLLVWKLDRLGRSIRALIDVMETIKAKGAHLRTVMDGIDTGTTAGRMLYTVLAALAEYERAVIVDRVTAGIAASRRAGKPHGRPSIMTAERTDHARRLLAEGNSWAKVARLNGISKTTLHRAFKRHPERTP
ncbi:recombinase family protein [Aureimonas phyllosphaerae]|uniref:DNA invertase Pin-like site-specific DNA recombinase n=1 Tax=Aureimonas phyllosphaerae TaxID=1166078 RepID=A0A7W6FWE6_9HYPH|nr:recombinase family protein [Aureimonas phyllosphaerae]MBB3938101.1 DNA invertase Pin-like site-specific DNA recombinase [Aureimonas phyllosphaerae]MBB3962108.1 DNA invertase Pin-like site-specific DNA recombinase [Aureimonas phyllosphaerae]SFF55938.1 Site-specific DNA recombinase [Aureimonas phyllosphaerae]